MNTGVIIVLILLLILYFAFEYSQLRSKYDKLFSWYSTIEASNPSVIPSIGPMRIVLTYERPWLGRLMSRPITQEMAEFILRLAQQEQINSAYMIYGPGPFLYPDIDPITKLDELVKDQNKWENKDPSIVNPLGPGDGYGNIPYNSDLVCGYRYEIGGGAATGCGPHINEGDLSLRTLWMHGYEEYVRQRFTSASTSVLGEWNYMFAEDIAPPLDTGDACSPSSFLSDGIQAGIGAAGVGAMLGAPEGGIGTIPGAIIGFIIGAGSSLIGKAKCF